MSPCKNVAVAQAYSTAKLRARKRVAASLVCVTILRMQILHICSARSIGGGEKHVASLANSLAQRGYNVFVALAPDAPLRALLRDVPREHIIELPMRNALSFGSAWKLARFVRSHGVQIIHAHL